MNLILITLFLFLKLLSTVGGQCGSFLQNNYPLTATFAQPVGIYRFIETNSGNIILATTSTLLNKPSYNAQGLIGYGNATQSGGLVPLLQFYTNAGGGGDRNYYTTDPSTNPYNGSTSTVITYVSSQPLDQLVPLWSFINKPTGTFAITINLADGSNANYWTLVSLTCYIGPPTPFSQSYPGQLYSYRHATSADDYLTTLTNPPLAAPSEGYNYVGGLGACYLYPHPFTTPLFEYASGTAATGRHHLYTTIFLGAASSSGLTFQGVPCYVQSVPQFYVRPIYQYVNSASPPSYLFTMNTADATGDTQYTWSFVSIPFYMFTPTCDQTLLGPQYLYRYQLLVPTSPIVKLISVTTYYTNSTFQIVGQCLPNPVPGTTEVYEYVNGVGAYFYTTNFGEIGSGGGSTGYTFTSVVCYMYGVSGYPNTHPLYRYRSNVMLNFFDYNVGSLPYPQYSLDGTVGYPINYP